MRKPRLLLVTLLLAALSVPAFAASGKVSVLVVDETNAPFPGVVVTLASTRALQPPVSLTTNGEGKAIFGVVNPGEGYKITIEMAGYQKIEEPNISVAINAAVVRAYKLQPQKTETIKVTAEKPVADIDAPTGSMEISSEFFEELPILGRNYQSALTLAPGVNDADGDGNPNVHGARERDFKANLDGVSNVDPLTGTFMSNINPDAIEEIEVVTSGADASYGRAVGGFANIITKQGSNDFEGAFKLIYRSSALDGNGASSLPAKDFEFTWYQPSISVTGKIIRDKLFYAANHEYHDIGQPIPIVGSRPVVVKTNYWRHLDKLTWQVSPRNKVNFQYSADPFTIGPAGVDSRTGPDSAFNYKQGGPTYLVDWQTPISPNFSVKSIAAWSDVGITRSPTTSGIKNGCGFDLYATDAFPKGSPQRRIGRPIDEDYCLNINTAFQTGSYFLTTTDSRQRLTLRSDATLFVNNFLGREHSFEFGIIGEDEHYDNTATFGPDSVFARGLVTRSAPPTSGELDPASAAGTIFRTIFSPGAPQPFFGAADSLTMGVYFQDTFRPHPNVNVKIGARFERENVTALGRANLDPRAERARFDRSYNICADSCTDALCRNYCVGLSLGVFTAYEGLPTLCAGEFGQGSAICPMYTFSNNALRANQQTKITNYNLGPRLSVQWDPKGDGKMKLFATYSKIYDKIFLAAPAAEQGPEQFQTDYFVSFESDPRGIISQSASNATSATVSQIRNDLRTPFVNEYTVGVSREIANETELKLTYIKRDYQDQLQDIDINHAGFDLGSNNLPCVPVPGTSPTIFTAQGKPDGKFDDCMGINVAGQGARPDGIPDLKVINPFFNQIFEIGNYNSTHYTAYELELVRRLYQNWQLEASYVWSKAIGDAEDFEQQLGDDPTTVQHERGYLSFDQRHVVKVNTITHLPVWNLKLGGTAQWDSGQPFSLIRVSNSEDVPIQFGSAQPVAYTQTRTSYPTGQRNDHRNQGYFTLGLNLQRDFQIGKANLTGEFTVENLLNDDSLYTAFIRNGREIAVRRFGREFGMSAKINF